MGTGELLAVLIFLRISYSPGTIELNEASVNICFSLVIDNTWIFGYPGIIITISEFLLKISIVSPTFILDLSTGLLSVIVVPLIDSIWCLVLVL